MHSHAIELYGMHNILRLLKPVNDRREMLYPARIQLPKGPPALQLFWLGTPLQCVIKQGT